MNIEQQYEPISNDDFEGEHQTLDDDIRKSGFPPLTNNNVCKIGAHVLAHIVTYSKGRLLSKYTDIVHVRQLMEAHKALQKMMIEGSKSGFKSVRLCKLLRPRVEVPTVYGEPSLVEMGWDRKFVGHAAGALWQHVCSFCTTPNDEAPASAARSANITASSSSGNPSSVVKHQYYAQYCAILQSSGMGKSRAVDEMSKGHFVIPVVLWEPNSAGHPPSDHPVCEYFSRMFDQRDTFINICGFLHVLFDEAAAVVRSLKDNLTAASSFREYMTKDMESKAHGKNRVEFYQNVVDAAKKHTSSKYMSYFGHDVNPSSDNTDCLLRSDGFPLCKAFHRLCQVILAQDRLKLLHKKRRRKSAPTPGPLVLIAFDEIYTLERLNDGWSRFGELRRAIRGLYDEPFFTLFLSTSGAAFAVASTPARDPSSRMVYEGNVVLPFSDLGFDQLARYLDFSNTIHLSTVTSLDHLVSYGRPLWNSFQPLSDTVKFAAYKLLGSYTDSFTKPLSTSQQLACLAQRIPIEFLSERYTSQISSDQEREQVHSHLRVLLKVEDTLETLVTTTPSEPVLSEAAYSLMTSLAPFSPARALQDILNGFGVNKGELGELLVALLFIIARDKAVGPANPRGQPVGNRWCLLPDLLSCLFCPSSSDPFVVDVLTALGWKFSTRNLKQTKSDLAKKFKDSQVYFTHFIKAQQQKVADVEYLMCLMARGAALLCATGDEIRRDNIGVIMFQSKNDRSFSDAPKGDLLRAMNPRTICDLDNVPVIRIFFALAATQPALRLVPHSGCGNVQKRYTAYDFWVAGFSPEVLSLIGAESATWKSILQVSDRWEKIYASNSPDSRNIRKTMNPGTATSPEFWNGWYNAPEL